ncbi:TPA: hypothetical protein ACPJ2O_004443 [Vibrio diabolicus]
MTKVSYTPFLKMKDSEISALVELDDTKKQALVPFFDFPRRDEKKTRDPSAVVKTKEECFVSGVIRSSNRISKKLKSISNFYLDDLDVDFDLKPLGRDTYIQLLEAYAPLGMWPVTGVDRTDEHHKNIKDALAQSLIKPETIALRLLKEDFEDFDYIKNDIEDLFEDYLGEFKNIDLVMDCRVLVDEDEMALSTDIITFIQKYKTRFPLRKVIVTGSMIPPSIGDVIDTNDEKVLDRKEVLLFKVVKQNTQDVEVTLGDYTCVSPDYSDADFFAEDMQNVMTGKIIYPIEESQIADKVLFIRGSRLKTDKTQFCDLCYSLVFGAWKPYFRVNEKSFGGNFIYNCATKVKKNATAATIVKPLVNAHITYMYSISPKL